MRILVSETSWSMSAIAYHLRHDGFLVTSAESGEDLEIYASDAVHDAIVLDADLPGYSAPRMIRNLREVCGNEPIFALCERPDRERSRALFAAGADHVASSTETPDELTARLRAFARRTAGFTVPLAQIGGVTVDFNTRRVAVGDIAVALTPSEYEIFEHLVLARRRLVSRDEMLTHLYGFEDGPDPKVIDVHLARIRKKLRTAGAEAFRIRTQNGRGFMLEAGIDAAA